MTKEPVIELMQTLGKNRTIDSIGRCYNARMHIHPQAARMISEMRAQLNLLEEMLLAPSGPSEAESDITAPPQVEKVPMADPRAWTYVRLTPEWKQFQAIVGGRVKSGEQWSPWGRLVDMFGWKNVIGCLEHLEPTKRWPAEAEALIQQKKRERSMYR